MTNEREYILYRWWDESGELLYVGQSVSIFNRVSSHRRNSEFFPSAAMMTIERLPDKAALNAAEREAIRAEHPLYNVVHRTGGGYPRKVVVADPSKLRASHWQSISVNDVHFGIVIRCQLDDGQTVIQGIVDDDVYECETCAEQGLEEDCKAWHVWADDGSVYDLHDWEVDLYNTQRWVSLDADDDTKETMFSTWLHRRHGERAA